MSGPHRDDQPAEFSPHEGVHRAVSFTCYDGGCDIGFAEHPAPQIASALLEDTGNWLAALNQVARTDVPAGVLDALTALHDTATGWVDWLDQAAARTENRR